jgi:YVTN family beta-propeller protein
MHSRLCRSSLALALCTAGTAGIAGIALVGCGDVAVDGGGGEDVQVAARAPRSSSIALSDDGTTVAMVNPSDDSLSIFSTADNTRRARIAVGDEPTSVVLTPDGKTAYVANRASATISRVIAIDTPAPSVDVTIDVGSEPVAVALSPTGARLFVAELAESRVSVIETRTMKALRSVAVDRPRALLVTNNGNPSDDDETLIVTQFYGVPRPGREAKDDGRTGRVRRFAVADLADQGDISLSATDSGFPKGGVAGAPTVQTSPNQLAALATANGKLYVTSVSASPEGPPRFDNNVFPVVYTADLATGQEIKGAAGTTNLARKIYDAIPSPSAASPRFVPGDLADLDFVPATNVAYAIGKGADVMVRVTWGDAAVTIGSTQNKLIDLGGNDAIGRCQMPTGVAIDAKASRAYVNCGVTRRLGVVDLGSQALAATVESVALPTSAAELAELRGLRFYFTGRGRWSFAGQNGAKGGEGWSSCGSCHPDGYSDNVTWIFGTGPRQTTSQDGTFSHGAGPQKQRFMNWSAINDEHHDFERNTRGVSGGLGVITTAPTLADCNQLDKETPVALVDGGAPIAELGKPLKELADGPLATCRHKDWDDVDAFVKTIRPPRAAQAIDRASAARGAALFVDGGCARCHGGAGWTISRRYYLPEAATNAALAQTAFTPPPFFPATTFYGNGGQPRSLISIQPAIAADDSGPAEAAPLGVPQSACSQRNVGTFGDRLNGAVTDALELRPASGQLVRAQGRAGYNVPSLYGLALGAPYLHHGLAPTLKDLFTNPSWELHTASGAANFPLVLAQPGKLDDLISYLVTIDAATPELAVPVDPATSGSHDVCPVL